MQTVLITGGTGMVGTHLTKKLLDEGFRVIILTRHLGNRRETKNLRFAQWDINKGQLDPDAVKQADFIVHLAGAGVVDKKWTPTYRKEIISSRADSARLLIDTLKNNENRVQALISASAIGWYGPDADPVKPFGEEDPAAGDFLGTTCKLWEQSVNPARLLDKRVVKFRIGIVLSNDGGALTEFRKPLHFGVAAILGNGKQTVSWIHIDDLCDLFISAINNTKMEGVYNAVAPEPVSNQVLMMALAKAVRGRFFLPIHVPAFLLKLIMGQRSTEVLKSTTVSASKVIATGFTHRFSRIEDALHDLTKK